MISIVIPVKNGGTDLVRCLDAIAQQRIDDDVETIVLDSSSSDGSAELARERGCRVHVLPAHEFNHGATRNLGAEMARGEILVFTSQDAYAAGPQWLDRLTRPIRDDERVAGSYGRQLPHEDATPPERFFLNFLYGAEPRVQAAGEPSELSMQTTLFSNANSAIRHSVWERFRFVEDIIMSEDQEWARRVLLDGHRLVYEPEAAVRHSHAYTVATAFKRFFDSGVSAEQAYLAGKQPAEQVLRREAVRYAKGEVRWLWTTGQRRWLPYTVVYEGAKYVGLQLGHNHRRLPVPLKRRFSALSSYWGEPLP